MSDESWRPGKIRPVYIERLTPVIVPAHPGWHSLRAMRGDGEHCYTSFWAEPVIAWSVRLVRPTDGDWITQADPVVAEGEAASYDALRRPDGRITVRGEAKFADEEAALDYLTVKRRAEDEAAVDDLKVTRHLNRPMPL